MAAKKLEDRSQELEVIGRVRRFPSPQWCTNQPQDGSLLEFYYGSTAVLLGSYSGPTRVLPESCLPKP